MSYVAERRHILAQVSTPSGFSMPKQNGHDNVISKDRVWSGQDKMHLAACFKSNLPLMTWWPWTYSWLTASKRSQWNRRKQALRIPLANIMLNVVVSVLMSMGSKAESYRKYSLGPPEGVPVHMHALIYIHQWIAYMHVTSHINGGIQSGYWRNPGYSQCTALSRIPLYRESIN